MPKWALDPLLTESTPLQPAGSGGEGHGAVNGNTDEVDSEGDYDSDFSEEDMVRVRALPDVEPCGARSAVARSAVARHSSAVVVPRTNSIMVEN